MERNIKDKTIIPLSVNAGRGFFNGQHRVERVEESG